MYFSASSELLVYYHLKTRDSITYSPYKYLVIFFGVGARGQLKCSCTILC